MPIVTKNEAEIGEGFSEVFKEVKIKREEVFVTSKLWYVVCLFFLVES